MNQSVIIKAVIVPSDPNTGSYQASVTAEFDDDTTEEALLSWYDDELSFTESEFVGLTREEVSNLFFEKDQAYLRS